MKIGWATPFNPKSAIARFSADVTRELLALGHEVSVIRSETGDALAQSPLATEAPVLTWKKKWSADQFDIIAFNIGDNYLFHGGLLQRIPTIRAVGIFHDWFLVNLFNGWIASLKDPAQAEKMVGRFYGSEALNRFREMRPEQLMEVAGTFFPMTEWLAEMLDGAVVHSHFYFNRVQAACPGPVTRLPLAYKCHPIPVKASETPGGMIKLLTLGVVNPNKRVESIIRAIGALPALKNSIAYRVAGSVTPEVHARLENLARECKLASFRMDGWISDELLNECIEEADIICCLRDPALEGASASVLEAMQSGRPVIVTDTGCYAEIPDSLVLKVRPHAESSDLQKHLSFLINSPGERRRMGQEAAEWAQKEADPARYAREVVTHFEKAIATQPLLRSAEILGREAGLWGLAPHDPFFKQLASKFKELWKDS